MDMMHRIFRKQGCYRPRQHLFVHAFPAKESVETTVLQSILKGSQLVGTHRGCRTRSTPG
jgi:hypothetical protein